MYAIGTKSQRKAKTGSARQRGTLLRAMATITEPIMSRIYLDQGVRFDVVKLFEPFGGKRAQLMRSEGQRSHFLEGWTRIEASSMRFKDF